MSTNTELIVFLYTGDRKYSGTNSTINIIIHGDDNSASKPIVLNNDVLDDFERGQVDTFRLSPHHVEGLDRFVKVERLEIWKSKTFFFFSDDWFVDKIVVENRATNSTYVFPMFRWIRPGFCYQIKHLDTSLPQFDAFIFQRKKELSEKKKAYEYHQRIEDGPCQVKDLPPDEQFSFDYKFDLIAGQASLGFKSKIALMFAKKWKSIEEIKTIYEHDFFETPKSVDQWDSDLHFARLRVASINPCLIRLFKTVPENFPITDELLGSLLEGLTIEEAIEQKRLFYVDLKILEGIYVKPGLTMCKPIALFFVNEKKELLPVAIQLFQEPGPENPIFTPLDPPMTWNIVKMWYNNADCSHHQSLSHLGTTHMMMEGFSVATHRNLSMSHPIFKILAPHFLYLIAINWRGIRILLSDGGWVDKTMNIGSKGMKELIRRGLDSWRLDVDGLLPENLKERGFDDPKLLPSYYFRDDAMLLYNAIQKYVRSYVNLYYTNLQMFTDDEEIQAFVQELVKDRKEGGCGFKGIPGNGEIKNSEQLVKIVTCIIYTCSVIHAAVNFAQYDEYGFPANYPMLMKGKPPVSKDAEITEADILSSIPDQTVTNSIMNISTALSRKGTNSLGDFEVQYIFEPKAMALVDRFRDELKGISRKIKERNEKVNLPYDLLDPVNIPNSVSI